MTGKTMKEQFDEDCAAVDAEWDYVQAKVAVLWPSLGADIERAVGGE